MSEKLIVADAFGGNFPVCSEKDKEAIEGAFKRAKDWLDGDEGKAFDATDRSCACELIARLLDGTASRGDQISLGIDMARAIYMKKMAAVALMEMIGGAMEKSDPLSMGGMGFPITTPGKKEWVN